MNEQWIESQAVRAVTGAMIEAATRQGLTPDGGCCAYFAPSECGIAPPEHLGKVWAIMLFRSPDGKQYANVVAWGKVQWPPQVKVHALGSFSAVVEQGRKLTREKARKGYCDSYSLMRARWKARVGDRPLLYPA